MSIQDDIEVIEKALDRLNYAGNVPGYLGLTAAMQCECTPERIRRLLDALKEEEEYGVKLIYECGAETIRADDAFDLLTKALELLKVAHSALDECMEGRVVFEIDAFLKENGHG
jgi:hypothetical protein